MLNSDSLFMLTTLLTSFAETYGAGSYGSGSYNESVTTTTDSPTPSSTSSSSNTTTTQPTDQATSPTDQPDTSTVEQSPTTTTQPTDNPLSTEPDSLPLSGTDPMWIIIASVIAFSALIGLFIIAAKKLRR